MSFEADTDEFNHPFDATTAHRHRLAKKKKCRKEKVAVGKWYMGRLRNKLTKRCKPETNKSGALRQRHEHGDRALTLPGNASDWKNPGRSRNRVTACPANASVQAESPAVLPGWLAGWKCVLRTKDRSEARRLLADRAAAKRKEYQR